MTNTEIKPALIDELIYLTYEHTLGDLEMSHLIAQEVYEFLKKLEPKIDEWYEKHAGV